jgi:hypothetical protein
MLLRHGKHCLRAKRVIAQGVDIRNAGQHIKRLQQPTISLATFIVSGQVSVGFWQHGLQLKKLQRFVFLELGKREAVAFSQDSRSFGLPVSISSASCSMTFSLNLVFFVMTR